MIFFSFLWGKQIQNPVKIDLFRSSPWNLEKARPNCGEDFYRFSPQNPVKVRSKSLWRPFCLVFSHEISLNCPAWRGPLVFLESEIFLQGPAGNKNTLLSLAQSLLEEHKHNAFTHSIFACCASVFKRNMYAYMCENVSYKKSNANVFLFNSKIS